MCTYIYCLFSIVLISQLIGAYNILGIFPYQGRSHVYTFLPIMKRLAEKGHKVTVISDFPLTSPPSNYKNIILRKLHKKVSSVLNIGYLDPSRRLSRYLNPQFLERVAYETCDTGLSSANFKKFMTNNASYDVTIIEFFNSDCFLGIMNKVTSPVIGISSCTLMPWLSQRFANPTHTAYIPNNFLPFSDKMTFMQRLENTIINLFHEWYYLHYIGANDAYFAKKYFDIGPNKLDNLISHSSLMLVNSHFSLNLPRPFVPNVIEIGGIHIGESKDLPQNLEKWISESKHGVIYFCMGSMLRGYTLAKEKKDAFLKAFSRLPLRVLWKWENETMDGKPDNVMIQKWMPQFDILCHPNVKVFISHGGLLGTMEAVHCGVPIIVMPQFADQHTNAKAIEANGGGVILPLNEVREETAYKALKTVLSSSFREKAKRLSERFRDRLVSPLDTAIYWVEYVARHKGAPHMRTAAVDMPFYQYYLLDVFGLILAVLAAFIYILYFICKLIIRKCITIATKLKQM